jgi:hypothetical protein
MGQVFTRDEIACHVRERTERVFDLIRARVAVGYIRYESNRGRAPDYLGWLEQSVAEYKRTKNLDALLDASFYALAEFQDSSIGGAYYRAEKEPDERSER